MTRTSDDRPEAEPPPEEIKDDLKDKAGPRVADEFLDGTELGLKPTRPLDLSSCRSFTELLEAMRDTSFGGRQLGEAAEVLEEMVRDEQCLVVGTFSGAMTVAKQGLVLCDMIDHGLIDVVVSTGALMTHGLIEASGMRHFKAPKDLSDRQMYYAGFDRVYDTLELEKNLDDAEHILQTALADVPADTVLSSHEILRRLGQYLSRETEGKAILKSAYEAGVPIYVPAFTDSELGLDLAIYQETRAGSNAGAIRFDPFEDLYDFARRVRAEERMGIFTIGGGVPRNWAQQVGPYLEIRGSRLGLDEPIRRYRYAVRICPEPEHWGGLSGCTYTEGVSWGKFVPESLGGRHAEVFADATIAWPLVVRAVMERCDRG